MKPKVSKLLSPKKDDFILDIACGNGNYATYLAQNGVNVVAFDYSKTMIELAKKRQNKYLDRIKFLPIDATNYEQLISLSKYGMYDKAVSNMAIMDIENINPLFKSLNNLLKKDGIFVFATQHPCFVTLTDKYVTNDIYKGVAIEGQPLKQNYYHRSFQEIFNICFDNGFIIDGFYEECYLDKEIPEVIIVRVKK